MFKHNLKIHFRLKINLRLKHNRCAVIRRYKSGLLTVRIFDVRIIDVLLYCKKSQVELGEKGTHSLNSYSMPLRFLNLTLSLSTSTIKHWGRLRTPRNRVGISHSSIIGCSEFRPDSEGFVIRLITQNFEIPTIGFPQVKEKTRNT